MTVKDEYTPDKLGWSTVGMHKWKHLDGYVIQRNWTLVGKKKDYFLCYLTENFYYKGANEATFSSLKSAKNFFNKGLA